MRRSVHLSYVISQVHCHNITYHLEVDLIDVLGFIPLRRVIADIKPIDERTVINK